MLITIQESSMWPEMEVHEKFQIGERWWAVVEVNKSLGRSYTIHDDLEENKGIDRKP